MKIKKICEQCGKEFEAFKWRNYKYCSKFCFHKSQERRVTIICRNCGKEFILQQYLKNQKFCSIKCAGEYRSKLIRTKWIKNICLNCMKEFLTSSCRDKKDRHNKYCSRVCANIGHRNRIIKLCKYCHKEFEIRKSKKNRLFCSQKCGYLFHSGKFHPNYNRKKIKCSTCKKEMLIQVCIYKKYKNYYCSTRCFSKGKREIRLLKNQDDNFLYNWFKGILFKRNFPDSQLTELDKKAIKANILLFKIRRSLNVNK